MRAPIRTLAAAALLVAALPATAYIRETTAVGNPNGGVCLWWGGRTVTYQVNASAITTANSSCGTPSAAEAEAVAGFDAWSAASSCTDFTFVHGTSTSLTSVASDGVNLVVFRYGRCTAGESPSANNCWDSNTYGTAATAITTTHFNATNGQITDADIEMFAWDTASPSVDYGKCFSCGGSSACTGYCSVGCNKVDVQAVVTHEAGHVLGLDHPCEDTSTPGYPVCNAGFTQIMNPDVGMVSQRGLKADDINGVCTIYPKGAATVTCGTVPTKKSGGGCSSAGGVGVAGLLLAALAFPRLRRRRR
jgi:hypothetical protein